MSQDADADATEFSARPWCRAKGGCFHNKNLRSPWRMMINQQILGYPICGKNRFASSRRVVDVPDLEQGRFLRLAFSTTLFKISSQKQGFNQEK